MLFDNKMKYILLTISLSIFFTVKSQNASNRFKVSHDYVQNLIENTNSQLELLFFNQNDCYFVLSSTEKRKIISINKLHFKNDTVSEFKELKLPSYFTEFKFDPYNSRQSVIGYQIMQKDNNDVYLAVELLQDDQVGVPGENGGFTFVKNFMPVIFKLYSNSEERTLEVLASDRPNCRSFEELKVTMEEMVIIDQIRHCDSYEELNYHPEVYHCGTNSLTTIFEDQNGVYIELNIASEDCMMPSFIGKLYKSESNIYSGVLSVYGDYLHFIAEISDNSIIVETTENHFEFGFYCDTDCEYKK